MFRGQPVAILRGYDTFVFGAYTECLHIEFFIQLKTRRRIHNHKMFECIILLTEQPPFITILTL
jgi:hypothetical protein